MTQHNSDEVKEVFLAIRITPEMKEDFKKLCKDYGTTPSDTIRRYIVMALRSQRL